MPDPMNLMPIPKEKSINCYLYLNSVFTTIAIINIIYPTIIFSG